MSVYLKLLVKELFWNHTSKHYWIAVAIWTLLAIFTSNDWFIGFAAGSSFGILIAEWYYKLYLKVVPDVA